MKVRFRSDEELYYHRAVYIEELKNEIKRVRHAANTSLPVSKREFWKEYRDDLKKLLKSKKAEMAEEVKIGIIKRPRGFGEIR